MTVPKWISLSEALQLISDAADDPKAQLLSAMRRGELAWRAFFEKIPIPSPNFSSTALKHPSVIATLTRMNARRLKQTIEVTSENGGNAYLANVSPDCVDWDTSELVVPEHLEPRLFDICVRTSWS